MDSAPILVCFGTRPEVVKLAPVLRELGHHGGYRPVAASTGQQADLVQVALRDFGLSVDHDLAVMAENQNLWDLSARILTRMRGLLEEVQPAAVIVQGDTTTCFAAALAAFYGGVPVAHVEAGLRTGDLVELTTRRGRLRLPAWIGGRGDPPPGSVFVPFFDEARLVNRLTLAEHCPISKQPDYKKCAVQVTKVEP